ncbi:alpha/beta hydrolase [Actinoplanes sp. NEAU-A12]|uniref:Alpha/beta hydrolase n=1 Tax=Actinoplanes sandaracinus TaxID=3045177 RepID=A0ABT6WTU9_9ACTN|nr:alpha/beta hydrolase [Actinoplanes sandaracinus]MDI6103167.1 alpha/beta hydrolase [Actinoplanes sandaracinus]
MTVKRFIAALFAMTVGVPGAYLFGPAQPSPAQTPAGQDAWLADPARLPDLSAAPAERVAAFFAGLPDGRADELARAHPGVVGNLDGAPIELRYEANQRQSPRWAGRQILALDPRGDGRIAEVLGDLHSATRVTVLVPGVDDTLGNFDTGHGEVRRRSPSLQGRRLYEQMRADRPGAHVAVVVWLGYDSPEGVRREAFREERATAGARALDRFVDALAVGRPELAITVVGHSYGSTVVGVAAHGLNDQVTDIVALGSPGMGADSAADLRTSARVWAGTAPGDWTRRLPGVRLFGAGHGRLPIDPAFGAMPLPCGNVDGHDGYFEPGSAALRAMASIGSAPAGDPR